MNCLKIVILLPLLLNYNIGYSQNNDINFEHFTFQNYILDIHEDPVGFLWFGTYDGLWRYDGYTFIPFRNNVSDINSLSNNWVNAVISDENNNLWIGTEDGLSQYNQKSDSFYTYYLYGTSSNIQRNTISELSLSQTGKYIWIGSRSEGLYKFDLCRKTITPVFKDELSTSGENKRINAFCHLPGNKELVGTNDGIYVIDEIKNEISLLSDKLNNIIVNNLLIYPNNLLWIATSEGLLVYNLDFDKITYKLSNTTNPSLTDKDVKKILKDKDGNIWLGMSEGGINKLIFDYKRNNISGIFQYRKDPQKPSSLSTNVINTIFEDNNSNIWIGGERGSLNKYSPFSRKFYLYRNDPNDKNSLIDNSVRTILEDSEGLLWVGTDRGLTIINRKTNTYFSYHKDLNGSVNNDIIKCLMESSDGDIWIGTDNGLNKFEKKTGRFSYHLPKTDSPLTYGNNYILCLFEDSNGDIWYGSWYGGLTKYNPKSEQYKIFKNDADDSTSISDDIVTSICYDRIGNLWIGTSKGLNLLDIKTGKFKQFRHSAEVKGSISNDFIWQIYEDSKNRLLILNKNGVDIFDRETFTFHKLIDNTANLNIAYGMLEDEMQNLWFSGTNGIIKYSANNETAPTYKRYSTKDGLQSNEFAMGAFFRSNSGEMFFGGTQGLNSFFPEKVFDDNVVPQVVFTEFSIFNKPISVNSKTYLTSDINFTEALKLSYRENVFSIQFSALHFTAPDENTYSYKLEGFDNDWTTTKSSRRYVTYTNLPAGEYTFLVKAANGDGIWNNVPKKLHISITPPFYKTTIFRLLFVFSFFISFILLANYRSRQFLRQKLALERMVQARTLKLEETNKELGVNQTRILNQNQLLEKQTAELSEQKNRIEEMAKLVHESDQSKLKFFTNISHEFRTPLTLIAGPIKQLITKQKKLNIQERLDLYNIIDRNANRLLNLINQLMDFRKLETGQLQLRVSETNISNYIKALTGSFELIAKQKNIRFTLNIPENICGWIDSDKFEKIISNLLSNGFKYTPANGIIEVSIKISSNANNESLEICISDSGIGIPENEINSIFNPFYQVDNLISRSTGTGLGLALTAELVKLHKGEIAAKSILNKGSTFTVLLPISKEIYKSDEIASEIQYKASVIENNEFIIENEFVSGSESTENNEESDSKPKLLIVDDSADIRNYLKSELSNDYAILEAAEGRTGFETALNYNPDLIISDIMMPVLDGNEMCRLIKTDERTSHIPVILLTARTAEQKQIEGLETGADDYITKPFNIEILRLKIHNIIETHARQREKFWGNTLPVISLRASTKNPKDEIFIENLFGYIDKNLDNEDLDIIEVAQEMNMSRAQLFRKIKALTNQTVAEFIYTYRLKQAAIMLVDGSRTISEICFAVGFKNPSHFTTRFKKFFGVSPTDYLKNKL